MNSFWGPLIGFLLTSITGILVYNYINKITYKTVSFHISFKIKDEKIYAPTDSISNSVHRQISAQKITIKNRGFRNLENVKIHFNKSSNFLYFEISDTKTISEKTIEINKNSDFLEIFIPYLPRRENIDLNLYFTSYSGSGYNAFKGAGGGYKVISESDYKNSFATLILIVSITSFAFIQAYDLASNKLADETQKPNLRATPAKK